MKKDLITKKINKLYSVFSAKWYDPFKKVWNFIIARNAEKELQKFLVNNLSNEKNVLELGCGTALNLVKINTLGMNFKNYLGLDFTESMLKIAQQKFSDKKNIEFRKQDIIDLKDLDNDYDIILCTWVLSHIPDPVKFVNDAQKHLKPGGAFFLVFYTKSKWYLHFWFKPIAEYLFFAKSLDKKIIEKFDNVISIKTSFANLVTVVEIVK
jgi:ubiquinone/menaquinone biosynthesis C-methylase UbiE